MDITGLNIRTLHEKSPRVFFLVWKLLLDLCKNEEIEPKIDKIFKFSEIQEACKYFDDRKNKGKIILVPDN